MGLFSEEFEKEEREFLRQTAENKISTEEIAQIRKKYEHNFNSNRDNFNKFKQEVIKKIKPEH